MSKIYRYEKLTFTGNENEEITFKVKLISNGDQATTLVDLPSNEVKKISNSNHENIGILKNLTRVKTGVYTNVNNPTSVSDSIIVEYYINNTLLVRHENLKTESEDPFIILKIKFVKS